MAMRLFSNKDILAAIRRRVSGARTTHLDIDALLDECDLVLAEISRKGDQVPDGGWIFLIDTADFSLTATALGLFGPVVVPDFHRGEMMRAVDGNDTPIVYSFVSAREARGKISRLAETGDPTHVWIDDFDPATDAYSFRFWPTLALGSTINVSLTYQRGLSRMDDSPLLADRLRFPANFAEALISGAARNICRDFDLTRKAEAQEKIFVVAVNDMMIYNRAQHGTQECIQSEHVMRRQRGQNTRNDIVPWTSSA